MSLAVENTEPFPLYNEACPPSPMAVVWLVSPLCVKIPVPAAPRVRRPRSPCFARGSREECRLPIAGDEGAVTIVQVTGPGPIA